MWMAAVAAILVLAVVSWIYVSDIRRARRLRESQELLANRECPYCGTPFGPEVARDAFQTHPVNEVIEDELYLDDDWEMSLVSCKGCGESCIYHRLAAQLQWTANGRIHTAP